MIILGVDTETTGLDFENDRITELGWCLWDTERKYPLVMQNDLIKDHGMQISPAITELTGITNEMTEAYGITLLTSLRVMHHYSYHADIMVAHNAKFDRGMIEAAMKRLDLEISPKPWVCTNTDIPYPKHIQTRKLTHLCGEHGFLNPFPHRALTDVLSMLQMTSGYDWKEILEVCKSPLIVLEAQCQKPWQDDAPDGKKDTDRAKALGFWFDFGTKKWMKNLRSCHADTFREQLKEANLKALVVG